ncbi:tyrosine-type recombinase/integrase [Methylocella silvestris]|uniref:Integrase n=1 Tax=Methylocella silvestris TaxID=199596 RepID=A0A2J7TK44_METSI|nr:integrase arm-type DNA-binding domain-containing protein [Methylocella silvestris]PNG27138.1 integrase [Methylocella silvestris]
MALTDAAIRAAKSQEGRTLKLSDGGGLQLWVTPSGSKLSNMAYRFGGKQLKLSLGPYPAVGLKNAREKKDAAKQLLTAGLHPGQQKKSMSRTKANAAANTFAVIADELLAKKGREGLAPATLEKVRWLLEFARPSLGGRPIGTITAPEVLAVLRSVESRGRHETARRLRSRIGECFRYAVASGRADVDPTFALRGALTAPKVTHRAALTNSKAFGGLLRAIDDYDGSPEVRAAMQLLALTFVRQGELRFAEWSEFDIDKAEWAIPGARMKMRRPHRAPLAPQAIVIIQELRTITGHGRLVFPSVRSASRCMSENTINAALRRMGFTKTDMSGHGFRAVASTILNESGKWNADAIEVQLAHVENDTVRRAYHRADYWSERVAMMTDWANRCDELRNGGIVVPLRA